MAALAAAVPVVWSPSRASAQPRFRRQRDHRLELRLLDDPTCPKEDAIRKDAAQLAGEEEAPFDPQGRHVIRVTVTKRKLYEASMELFSPDGTRHPHTPLTYQATTCAQATREATVAAVGFIPLDLSAGATDAATCDEACIQKRLDAAREEAREAGRREGERDAYERGRLDGRKEREAEILEGLDAAIDRRLAKRRLPPPPEPVDPRRMPYPFAVSAAGVISLGWALDVAPGVAIGAEWRPAEMFALGIEARLMFPAKVGRSDTLPDVKAGVVSGLVTPCLHWKILVGCGALETGMIWLEQDDITGLRFAAGPRLGIDVPFADRFSVRVLGDLLFPITRTGLPIKGADAFVEPVVSGFLTGGFSVAF